MKKTDFSKFMTAYAPLIMSGGDLVIHLIYIYYY